MKKSPLDNYRKLIQSGKLTEDSGQLTVVRNLQEIYSEFIPYYHNKQKSFFFKSFKKVTLPKGLYIYGDVGRGKSMLMDVFFDSLDIEKKRRVHFNAFMNEMHSRIFEWRKNKKLSGVSKGGDDPIPVIAKLVAEECNILCFDEFQIEDIADAMIIGRLFENLFELNVLVIATSNIRPDELYKDGLNRSLFLPFIDILKNYMNTHYLVSDKDYRLDRVRDRPVYYSPITQNNREDFEKSWTEVIGSSEEESISIQLKGRQIDVLRSVGRCVRFNFSELCQKPLGAIDYLAIADKFDIIFISDIPMLDETKRNETKRFINLIDTLYESQSLIFILAEKLPSELLQEGKDLKIFRRTTSRLEEMQSVEYLNKSSN
jgi:cell division protein ZapE